MMHTLSHRMMDTDPRVREAVVDMVQAHAAIARRQLETLGSSMAEASVAGKEVDWREVRDVSLTASSSSQLICRGALPLDVVTDEIVHTLVGSIGLILGVPITTYLAALLFRGDRLPMRPGELEHTHPH